ncbi:hypothetical protein [Cedecea sp.]|uniref:hypothetical protein n=1 Tax=Cedecea sp. TaxID=1970739 RepID=UPI002F3F0D3E
MWREANLAFTDRVAALNCAIVPAHPWIYGLGQQTENGAYLSPVNAINYLATKLASAAATDDVVIFMVTGSNHDGFMKNLEALTDVFPAPTFTQVKRLAQSSAELAVAKMQLPAKGGSGLPAAIPLSVPTTRAALTAKAIAQAQQAAGAGTSLADLKGQLSDFATLRNNLISAAADGLADLQGESARAWVFTGADDMATTLTELVKSVPQPSAVFCAAVMMVGENLQGIKGVIHELCPNPGA